MKAADENFELQAIMATTEEEAKHRASVEVVGLKSEISFKVSVHIRNSVLHRRDGAIVLTRTRRSKSTNGKWSE